jgi:hypothetical protein
MLAMLTIVPPRPSPVDAAAIMARAATWVVSSIALTLTSNIRSHSSTVMSSSGAKRRMPALLTRTSTPPSESIACCVAARASAGSVRSAVIAVAPMDAATPASALRGGR